MGRHVIIMTTVIVHLRELTFLRKRIKPQQKSDLLSRKKGPACWVYNQQYLQQLAISVFAIMINYIAALLPSNTIITLNLWEFSS